MTKSGKENNDIDRSIIESVERYESMLLTGTKEYFDEEDLLDVADYYYNDMSRPDDALQCIDYVLQLHPSSRNAVLMRAEIYFYEGKREEAWKILSSLRNTRDPEVMYYYGLFSLEEDKVADAVSYYSKAYFYQKGDALDMFCQMAWDMLEHNETRGVPQWIDMLPERQKDNTRVREVQAELQRQMGDFPAAIATEQRLIDRDPYNVHYWNGLTKLYCQSGRYTDAIESVTYAIDIAPNDPEALILGGEVYTNLKENEKAADFYARYIAVDDKNPHAYFDYAHVLICMDKYEEALVQLAYALKYSDNRSVKNMEIYELLSTVYWAIDDYRTARHYLELAKEQGLPEWAYAFRKLSIDLKEGKKVRLARPTLRVAELIAGAHMQLDPLFFTLFNAHRLDLIIKVMDEIEKTYPRYKSAFLPFRSATYYFEHKGDEFLRYLKEAVKREPERTKAVFSSLFPPTLDLGSYYDYAESLVSKEQYPDL